MAHQWQNNGSQRLSGTLSGGRNRGRLMAQKRPNIGYERLPAEPGCPDSGPGPLMTHQWPNRGPNTTQNRNVRARSQSHGLSQRTASAPTHSSASPTLRSGPANRDIVSPSFATALTFRHRLGTAGRRQLSSAQPLRYLPQPAPGETLPVRPEHVARVQPPRRDAAQLLRPRQPGRADGQPPPPGLCIRP